MISSNINKHVVCPTWQLAPRCASIIPLTFAWLMLSAQWNWIAPCPTWTRFFSREWKGIRCPRSMGKKGLEKDEMLRKLVIFNAEKPP